MVSAWARIESALLPVGAMTGPPRRRLAGKAKMQYFASASADVQYGAIVANSETAVARVNGSPRFAVDESRP